MYLTRASFLPRLRPRCGILLNLLTNRRTFQITCLSLVPWACHGSRRTCSCVNRTHYPCLIYFPISTHLLVWIRSRWWWWGHSRMPCWCSNRWSIQGCDTNRRCSVENSITRSARSLTMAFANSSDYSHFIATTASTPARASIVKIWVAKINYF